jgi:hypothetical protein
MRKILVAALAAGSLAAVASPAIAATSGPPLPKIPQDCHDWNDLLGIDNVRDCGEGGS